jgi:spore germination cell wall hydrolase CwlJ-like protein
MRLFPDAAWAVATIWMEARGEPQEGRQAVGEVILNRRTRNYTSDGTVPGTVLRPYQFSGWNSRDPNRALAATLDDDDPLVVLCQIAWLDALKGSDLAHGALLYFNPASGAAPAWVVDARVVATIGRHVFYVPLAAG